MQTIVDRHAGVVVIESVEGRGTSVVIRLPLQGVNLLLSPAHRVPTP